MKTSMAHLFNKQLLDESKRQQADRRLHFLWRAEQRGAPFLTESVRTEEILNILPHNMSQWTYYMYIYFDRDKVVCFSLGIGAD